MIVRDATAPSAAPQEPELWTIRSLVTRHKMAATLAGAVMGILLASILVAVFASTGGGAVSDATTCTQWGSANQDQQAAYARLYLREHGPLRGAATSPARVINAINTGCTHAYIDDVSDTTTVVQAISGHY